MPISMYEKWLDIRDFINNALIRFLLRHCWLDALTSRAFASKMSAAELERYVDEKRVSFS